jgi:hypothetical protein
VHRVETSTHSVRTYGFGNALQLTDALEPWQGGRAQVLGYSANGWLDVWLTKPAEDWVQGPPLEGGLLLQCVKCVSVRFLANWGPIHLRVEGTSRGEDAVSLRIHDAERFHVACWDAQVTGIFASFEALSAWRSGKRSHTGPIVG